MFKPKVSEDLKVMLTSSLAIGVTASVAGADIITVLDPDHNIITDNSFAVSVFAPTLTFTPPGYYGTNFTPNSINMYFTSGYYGTFGLILSNLVAAGAAPPVDSPSLLLNGSQSLNNLGTTIDGARTFEQPVSFVYYGTTFWDTADLNSTTGDFSLTAYADGDFAYLGYATSDLTNFGYLQFQRESLTTYRLIGYRYGTAGESIVVKDLSSIPAPSALATLAVAGLLSGRRRKRSAS